MSKGNWTRIVHDDRLKAEENQFTYFCAEGHSWVVPFEQLEEIIETESENNCPTCTTSSS